MMVYNLLMAKPRKIKNEMPAPERRNQVAREMITVKRKAGPMRDRRIRRSVGRKQYDSRLDGW